MRNEGLRSQHNQLYLSMQQPNQQYQQQYQQPYQQMHQQPYDPEAMQRQKDEDNLRMLGVFYYVFGSLCALGFLIFLLYTVVFSTMMPIMAETAPPRDAVVVESMMGVFYGIFVFGMLLMGTMCTLCFIAPSKMRKRESYGLIFTAAILVCLSIPLGTVLGIFTMVVMNRPSVRKSFGKI